MSRTPALTSSPGTGKVTLSVIAPCLNEQANIDALVDRTLATFEALAITGELVLVDDGSCDDTWQRISERSRRDARVRGVRHRCNRGMEAAWRSGLATAAGELVCLIDADLQNRPEDIALLYRTYRSGSHDLIQAVRHPAVAGERCLAFTYGLNFLLNWSFGTRLRDSKSGFILCKRPALETILQHRFHYRYYQCFIGAAAHRDGFSIAEVDTAFDLRHAGRSFLPHRPIRVSMRVLWELVKFRVEVWIEAGRCAPSRLERAVTRTGPLDIAPGVRAGGSGVLAMPASTASGKA